ncbi:MAG: OsmC family protein [archaeon]|nr:OsmC family protein [archaeon]MDA1168053.1 OsmC family protein [archaeon]
MKASVRWGGGTKITGVTSKGQELHLNWEDGPSPMQVTLQMIGACSLVDVVLGLKEREFSDVWVECDAIRATDYPRIFTNIHMEYHVKGSVPLTLVQRIVEKSHEKYCSVSNMLSESVSITFEVKIHSD